MRTGPKRPFEILVHKHPPETRTRQNVQDDDTMSATGLPPRADEAQIQFSVRVQALHGETLGNAYSEGDTGTVSKLEGFNGEINEFQISWDRSGRRSAMTYSGWHQHCKIIGEGAGELDSNSTTASTSGATGSSPFGKAEGPIAVTSRSTAPAVNSTPAVAEVTTGAAGNEFQEVQVLDEGDVARVEAMRLAVAQAEEPASHKETAASVFPATFRTTNSGQLQRSRVHQLAGDHGIPSREDTGQSQREEVRAVSSTALPLADYGGAARSLHVQEPAEMARTEAMRLAVANASETKMERERLVLSPGVGAKVPVKPLGSGTQDPSQKASTRKSASFFAALWDMVACRPECKSDQCRKLCSADDEEDAKDGIVSTITPFAMASQRVDKSDTWVEVDDGCYRGEWCNSQADGTGELVKADGSWYMGGFLEGKAHGEGKFKSANGTLYEGQWHQDLAHGHGTYYHEDGTFYKGQWKKDEKSGVGFQRWHDGYEYTGDFFMGGKHGRGIYRNEQGEMVYEGEFKDDKMDGNGKYHFADGRTYKGQWHRGQMNGQGAMKFPDGSSYTGGFTAGKRDGLGTMTWQDGSSYSGQWKMGKQDGGGTTKEATGKQTVAIWSNGVQVGSTNEAVAIEGQMPLALTDATPSGTPTKGPRMLGSSSRSSSKQSLRGPVKKGAQPLNLQPVNTDNLVELDKEAELLRQQLSGIKNRGSASQLDTPPSASPLRDMSRESSSMNEPLPPPLATERSGSLPSPLQAALPNDTPSIQATSERAAPPAPLDAPQERKIDAVERSDLENKSSARDALREAVRSRDVQGLRQAIERGKQVGLSGSELVDALKALEEEEFTQMKMKIEGIDYDELIADPALTAAVKTEIKMAVMEEAGSQIKESSVHVDLTKGSVVATIKIFEPTTDKLKSSTSLTTVIARKICLLPGIDAVARGQITVSNADSEDSLAQLDKEAELLRQQLGGIKHREPVSNQQPWPFLAVGRVKDKQALAICNYYVDLGQKIKTEEIFKKLLGAAGVKFKPDQRTRLKWNDGSLCCLMSEKGDFLYCAVHSSLENPESIYGLILMFQDQVHALKEKGIDLASCSGLQEELQPVMEKMMQDSISFDPEPTKSSKAELADAMPSIQAEPTDAAPSMQAAPKTATPPAPAEARKQIIVRLLSGNEVASISTSECTDIVALRKRVVEAVQRRGLAWDPSRVDVIPREWEDILRTGEVHAFCWPEAGGLSASLDQAKQNALLNSSGSSSSVTPGRRRSRQKEAS